MRVTQRVGLIGLCLATAGRAQEEVASQQQPQTVAPNVTLQRPQPGTCGAAPSVDQINRLAQVVRRMFPQSGAFDAALAGQIRQSCQRNRAAAYLIRVIAANNWAFLPPPVMKASYPPGMVACGSAASSADLNAVIGKLRPLFGDPRLFNANVARIGGEPCIGTRATLYLFNVMSDNDLSFRR